MPTKSKPPKSCSTRPGICWKCTTACRTIAQLVDERMFYLMPMMSPDSRDAHIYEPNTHAQPAHRPAPRRRRPRRRRVDDEPRDDLDGDGNITEMRSPRSERPLQARPRFSGSDDPRQAGRKGQLHAAGRGRVSIGRRRQSLSQTPTAITIPNRDWAWHWQPDYVQTGRVSLSAFDSGKPHGGRLHHGPSATSPAASRITTPAA